MRSRAARLTLLVLFLVVLGATAYLFWKGESLATAENGAARVFDSRSRETSQLILEIRASQQAYVAAGQASGVWAAKVTSAMERLRSTLESLRTGAISPQAQSEIDHASSVLTDFAQLDRRAREYTRTGQNLLASDLIFTDGFQLTEATSAAIEQARTAELDGREQAIRTFRRRQMFSVASAAAASLLVVLLLVPAPDTPPAAARVGTNMAPPVPQMRRHEPAYIHLDTEGWSPPQKAPGKPGATSPDADPRSPAAPTESEPDAARAAGLPVAAPADFVGLASLCTELARLVDTRALPALLERAATLLDATGIILWIADPDGRELNPIVSQGYPQQLINRLGTITRDAENATAAAFRSSLLQTVHADTMSNGAIAAPLVTPAGCVGVMAAEVRRESERQESKLATAVIVAAQLATLIGPPSTRPQGRVEAAGA